MTTQSMTHKIGQVKGRMDRSDAYLDLDNWSLCLDTRAVQLHSTQRDGSVRVYTLRVDGECNLTCSCPDYDRCRRNNLGLCKHGIAALKLGGIRDIQRACYDRDVMRLRHESKRVAQIGAV